MNPYLRNGLALLAGLIMGSIVNMFFITLSPRVIPYPEGMDVTDMESLAAAMESFKPKHFIMPFLAHALGTLSGAYIAARLVTKARAFFGFLIGIFFFLGGLLNAFNLPAPFWFVVLDLVVAYFPMAIIGQLWARKHRS